MGAGIPIAAAAAAGGLFLRSRYEEKHFVTENYEIRSEKVPEAFDGFRFIMLADLHGFQFGDGLKGLKKALVRLDPDAVICVGDMILGDPGADMSAAFDLYRFMDRRWPVLASLGNHEQRLRLYREDFRDMGPLYEAELAKTRVHMLDNRSILLKRDGGSVRVTGLTLQRWFYRRHRLRPMPAAYLNETLGKCDRNCYNILAAHNPFYFRDYAGWGADLVLSGHVHGGVIILPGLGGLLSPQVEFFPEYYAGHYREGASDMIVSRGLYMHRLRVRLNNLPEISCVTLRHLKRKDRTADGDDIQASGL